MNGWLCSKCGNCYSPFVTECSNCNTKLSTAITSNWIYDKCPLCGGIHSDPPLTGCPRNYHYGKYCGFLLEG